MAVGFVSAAATGIRRYLAFGTAWRTETELRQRLFAHLQRLHFAFHDQAQTGQLMSRAATDLQQIQGFVVLIPITVSNAVTVLAVAVILLRMNAGLALLALGALPFVNVVAKRFSSAVHPVSMELQQELAQLATVVEETVTGIRVVKGFGAEPLQAEPARDQAHPGVRPVDAGRPHPGHLQPDPRLPARPRARRRALVRRAPGRPGHLTIGELVAFNAYVVMLIWPLRMLGMLIAQAQRAVAAAERVDEILADRPGHRRRPAPGPAARRRARSGSRA